MPSDPIRTKTTPAYQQGQDGRGLVGQESPGTRSGAGSDSVLDQMQKDDQRNANRHRGEDLPLAASGTTA